MKTNDLTIEERRTYQCLVSHGFSKQEAKETALDGVHVDDVRKHFENLKHTD